MMHHEKAQPVTTKYDIARGCWACRPAVACGSPGSAIADRPGFAPRRGRSAVGLYGGTVAGHATGLQPAITSIDRSLITHAILPAAPALYGKGRSFSFTYPTNQLD